MNLVMAVVHGQMLFVVVRQPLGGVGDAVGDAGNIGEDVDAGLHVQILVVVEEVTSCKFLVGIRCMEV